MNRKQYSINNTVSHDAHADDDGADDNDAGDADDSFGDNGADDVRVDSYIADPAVLSMRPPCAVLLAHAFDIQCTVVS